MIYVYVAIGLYLLIMNIVTTKRLLLSNMYEGMQKFFQVMIIWLIPFIGAILIANFLNDEPIKIPKSMPRIKARVLELIYLAFVIQYNISSGENESFDSASIGDFGGDSGGGSD
jgi:hypothetical protein